MRSFSCKAMVAVLAIGLTIWFAKAGAAEWKEFAEANTGVFYYDAADIRSPSEGFVRAWIHNLTKHETNHVELNCKDKTYRVLDFIQYDEAKRIKNRDAFYDKPNPTWFNVAPKSVPESLHGILCP